MTNRQIFILFLILQSFTFASVLRGQNSQADNKAAQQRRIAIREALRKPDGLHQAAKINGGTFRMSAASYGLVSYLTLERLAETSDIAIIGTPLSSETKIINNGRNIVTEYKVKVAEPIQGKVQWGDVVTVDLPGGDIVFDDGTTAQVDAPDFPRLQKGHRYVLYLVMSAAFTAYQPSGGPEGVFELKSDGKVRPFADAEHSSAASPNDDVADFVGRVRVAAGRQKRQ